MYKIRIFYLVLTMIYFVFSQDSPKEMKIDVQENGKIDKDGEMSYYTLKIPKNIEKNKFNLVFRVKEIDSADVGKEDFSDPDIYVSKTNQRPKSPESSTWYSERYGEDLLSISGAHVFEDEVFYVGIYCMSKCSFELLAKLEEEFEIQEGTVYKAFIIKEDSLSFRIKSKSDFEELEIVAFSPKLGFFKIYVKPNERPSSQNTIQAIPSWVGGYSVNIVKGSNNYCNDCYYYIVIESGSKDVEVYFYAKYEKTVTNLGPDEVIFSAIKPFQTHCYQFYIDDISTNENVIIQAVMFSGTADMKIKMNDIPEMNSFVYGDPFYHEILTEKIIKVTPQDRKSSNRDNSKASGPLTVCLKSYDNASYILKMVYESDVGDFQKYNFLVRGREINGYLPKGKATRYRVLEFDTKSDITISMNVKKGDPKLYGYICESVSKCFFDKERIGKELSMGTLILPQQFSIGYSLTVSNEVNTCHKKMENSEDIDLGCATMAIVMCEGDEECEFMLRTTRDDAVYDLQPRKPHYQIIPFNETDYYKFVIEDEQVSNVTIILNTLSGNADLYLDYTDEQSQSIIKVSEKEAYLPDVIKIDRVKLRKANIKGTYNIRVYGSSFSSYSIYYYTHSDKKENENIPQIGISLETGHIIKDIFEPETDYKIYSFEPKLSTNLDIRITLTPEKDDFYLFVLYDLKKFVFNKELPDKSEGFIWSDNFLNEVIISKSDPNYKRDSVLYIVVVADYSYEETTHTSSFWIGATTEDYPFLLYEGVPHSVTLDEKYKVQTYWYTHSDISNTFSLSINAFYGRVDVYADFQEITNFDSKDIAGKELDTDTAYITIKPDVLKERCKQMNNCGIFIYIKKSSSNDAQYLLVAKSHPNKAEILSNGIIRQDNMFSGEFKNYNIITDNKKLNMIYVSFLTGYGEVYINVPKDIQNINKAKYPTRTEYDYKGSDYYLGEFINIDSDKLPKDCDTCQILVTVYGMTLIHGENEIEYTISFYNESRKLNQNQPLRGNIKQDEIQYFNVNFDKSVTNVYVSLTNMNGDVDIYMNYGLEYPTMDNYTWMSNTLTNEFIDFNKNDNYFVSSNLTDLSGDYTIMLVGLSNSTYTLYITSHPRKIIPINEYQPASCKSNGSHPCFFRFNDFYTYERKIYDIIITTDFLYGTGSIYANLYKETDYEIYRDLPTATRSDYSSVKSNTRNMLNIKIDKTNDKLTDDSMILISVECQEKCFLDLNLALMFDSDFKFIETNKENLFYIYKSAIKSILVYYNWSQKDINLSAFAYSGSARINMFTNTTRYDESKDLYVMDKNNLGQIYIDSQNTPVFNTVIQNKNSILTYNDIFFEVEALSDIGFYIKLTNDKEWSNIKLNKYYTFNMNKASNSLYFYFDMMEDYDYSIISIKSLSKDVKLIAYIKYAIIDKSTADEKTSQHDYIVPSDDNYEYTGYTYSMLSQISIKIPAMSVNQNSSKYSRVLVNLVAQYDSALVTKDIQAEVMVSPKINGRSIVQAESNKLIYSVMEADKKDFTIYDLKKQSPSDDLMIIEISNCSGDVKFKLSDVLTSSRDTKSILDDEEINAGKKTLSVDLNNFKSEDFYLTLWPHENYGNKCFQNNDRQTYCNKRVETLIHYFTTTKEKYQTSFLLNNGVLSYDVNSSNSITLRWIRTAFGMNDVITLLKSEYALFISEDESEFMNMDSVCYLSRMYPAEKKYKIVEKGISSAVISGLEPGKKYFANVMAKTENNEILAYRSIEILYESKGLPGYLIGLIVILVLILAYLVYYFYKKYRLTRKVLEYEVNDVRNMSSIPRTDTEMKNVIKSVENKKYVVLSGERVDESV